MTWRSGSSAVWMTTPGSTPATGMTAPSAPNALILRSGAREAGDHPAREPRWLVGLEGPHPPRLLDESTLHHPVRSQVRLARRKGHDAAYRHAPARPLRRW